MLEKKASHDLGQIFHFPETQFVVGMSVMPLFTGVAASVQNNYIRASQFRRHTDPFGQL